ncbi:MAG: hypothetical protein GAK30_00366 [Paracidovorax wautersii]|uniref:Carboxymuconolactone decarboxylase-like domain-containing protein n=1 Tax=Paracidovorax wautersii TaxID=1177982 RepID=A0A7V8FRX6_9BURK|nr:MAG: hypothetical protein GAK30_00366 [Paracidovorax wautersii]
MTQPTVFPDLVDTLAHVPSHGPVHAARQQRDKTTAATQGSLQALLDPALPQITLAERLLAAAYTARLTPAPELAAHYLERLQDLGGAAPAVAAALAARQHDTIAEPRLRAILAYTHRLATQPATGSQATLQALQQAGLDTAAVVALSQLVAFVSYQARVVAGVRALASHPGAPAPAAEVAATPAAPAAPLQPLAINGYVDHALTWSAWLDTVQLEQATPEQLEVLEASHPKAKTSDYYLLLVQQPEILRQRQIAFNAIMYAPGGLSRAERELAATVVSRVNGCVYCASVHAERFGQLAKRNDVIAQVFTDPQGAGTSAREKAIVQASIVLTREPAGDLAPTLAALRAQGLDDLQILDLVHAVAVFGWANRLMLNLGAPD